MITKFQLNLLMRLPIKARCKIEITRHGCWIWKGVMNRNGYGRFWHKGKYRMTHRIFWEFLKKENIEGKILDHVYAHRHCSRACCNPTHVSPVTQKQNFHRGRGVPFK